MERLEVTPSFIYINGYPGVGKLTIAKEICKILAKAKVLSNHILIDPVAAVVERTADEYQPLRQALRREVLKSIATAISTRQVTWVCTDQQSSSRLGSSAAKDYQRAAAERGSPFISVILRCQLEENMRRAVGEDRGSGGNTKLTDLAVLRSIREREDIFRFHDGNELELDVTYLTPKEAAVAICEHIDNSIQKYYLQPQIRENPTGSPSPIQFADIAGFKHVFVSDLQKRKPDSEILFQCWVVGRPRRFGGVLFLPVGDSTGSIQAVAEASRLSDLHELKTLKPGSSLELSGVLSYGQNRSLEIIIHHATIISRASGMLHPDIRQADRSILESHNADHVLSHRHLYLRNPIISALNLYRSQCFLAVHKWFEQHKFVEFSAPLITPSILYDPNSAIHVANLKAKRQLFLSQCAGFYLEAAAHAHERVYNLGPSFRNESRTNRHLMEYWHIKAELCSGKMDDIINMVEVFLSEIFKSVLEHTQIVAALLNTEPPSLRTPFQRVTYREALKVLHLNGQEISFGQNISSAAEKILTDQFGGPIWVTQKPRSLEPFPYCVSPDDEQLTMTADLISPDGFGEICGVAEKSFTREELEQRMKEKGKSEMTDVYGWVLQSRDFGMVPHTAFGMGFERMLRWFCGVPMSRI